MTPRFRRCLQCTYCPSNVAICGSLLEEHAIPRSALSLSTTVICNESKTKHNEKIKQSLKMLIGKSEAVILRMTNRSMAKRKRTNNDIQNITQKTKDRAKRTPLKRY